MLIFNSFIKVNFNIFNKKYFNLILLQGNFPNELGCEVCSEDNSEDWKWKRCIWCHKTVHTCCRLFLGEVCSNQNSLFPDLLYES